MDSAATNLRPLTPEEARQDFVQLANYFRTLYGPLEYKEARFNFSFEQWVKEIDGKLNTVRSDEETFGLFAEFIARFQDGHAGIHFAVNSSLAHEYSVPVFIAPMADTYVVANVGEELRATAITVGDEVIHIDGKKPDELLPVILKYHRFATAESDRHYIYKALNREFYMTDLKPVRNSVTVTVRKASGRLVTENLVWKITSWNNERLVVDRAAGNFSVPAMADLQAAAGNSILAMSKPRPFFATEQVLRDFNFRIVTADSEHRKKYGLKDSDKPDIFAALYKYRGKTILLVRNFAYYHWDFPNATYMNGYKAILDQWESMADVLVLDQTHNGGGSYCEDFFRLFIREQADGFVQALNVDRKWIADLQMHWPREMAKMNGSAFDPRPYLAMGSLVEAAYDRGETLSAPVALISGNFKAQPLDYTWKKPLLVLTDELAGSCGDAFPMLVRKNNIAKIFGARTMGLGGNVEPFPLTNSQSRVFITRGLFTAYREDGNYSDPFLFIENNGVEPDYPHVHTVDDFRKGFVGYVKAFSAKAVEQIPGSLE
jgi:hypothetical protein